MSIDPARQVQSVYVPMSDGVRLAVDVWLPVERIAAGEQVGTALRSTRYHRAGQPAGPEPELDTNHSAGKLWTDAGFALVLIDARGTGASFGARTMELGEREISDCGEVVDWIAAQPWSNGRVGVFGTSYEGQAAELTASLGNPHVTAVAALFSPADPYRELFYPGGCATSERFALWMCGSQLKDGVLGAAERLSALTGLPLEEVPLPEPVKPVDGPDGPALLEAAIAEHQANVDVQALLEKAPFSDDRLPGLDWRLTTPAAAREAIEAAGVPMLIRAGWLDGAFAAGALRRFATYANDQQVEIGPWGHGGGTVADTLRPGTSLDGDLSPQAQDRRLLEFFTRHVERAEPAPGKSTLTFATLGAGGWRAVEAWPPAGVEIRRWHLNPEGRLAAAAGPETTVGHVVDPAASSGATNRWLAVDLDQGAAYPGRRDADEALLTFTSAPLDHDLRVVGFPVVSLPLSTSGSDGAVYVYLEAVGPDGQVSYVTEGCLRFVHRATTGPPDPAGLGVPRSFGRSDALTVAPGQELDLHVELLPVAALIEAGHRLRIAIGGHDPACFARYGPAGETFTLRLGERSSLDLPMLA